MRLLKLSLRNFKGLKDFTVEPKGNDISVYGENATGKSTLADSFFWLLFDKDSFGRKDFEIKTLQEDGQPIHGLEHEVEGMLEVDGKHMTLRKAYSEIWIKKRGSASAEFTGHTTKHYLNDVPIKKLEYETRVYEIMDENVFKLLTNPKQFPEVLHWQERRKLLLTVCGDLSDEAVIASDKSLAPLTEILGQHSLEEHRLIITQKKRKLNEELRLIPVRIDEISRFEVGLGDNIDKAAISGKIKAQRAQVSALSRDITTTEAGGGIARKIIELRQVEAGLLHLRTTYQDAQLREQRKIASDKEGMETYRRRMQATITEEEEWLKGAEGRLVSLRAEFKLEVARDLEYTADEICPTCKQSLPTEQIQAAIDKATEQFNTQKAQRLEAIQAEGKRLRAKVDEAKTELTQLSDALKETEDEIARLESLLAQLSVIPIDDQPDYQTKVAEKYRLEQEIAELKAGTSDGLDRLKDKKTLLEVELAGNEATLAKIIASEANQQRIEELKAQEKTLAAEYERLEHELYLTAQFTRAKVEMLEGQINSKFTLVQFKLFRELINGGIEDCCDVMKNGVPYSSLSNSERINIGLEIINTLSDHFGQTAPIWVDNSEAVVELLPTVGQQIRLYVSEGDKIPRVEQS